MKIMILFTLLTVTSAWSKNGEVKKFNDALMQKVQQDMNPHNEDQFRVKSVVGRGPASVESEPEGKYIQDDKKIDKMNQRQIGPNKW